ncbi:MAG: UvrD-helicase domain-containing protein [Spirochaetaceae bacterium]|nr:UvrD-helicase domain-containing protein [Spirochaetaceae bacterium]
MSQQKVEQWLLFGDGTDKSPELSLEQRKAVTCMQNTVTAAGAGSGKTFVLSRRYAYLVCVKKYKVSEILTLTFTRKATGEMYSRIYKTLAEIVERFEDFYAKQAIQEFFTAKIQTLDTYCSYIVRKKAHSFGIRPDFVIDKDRAEELARQTVLPFLLSHRENHGLQILTKTNSIEDLAEGLFVDTILRYSTICNPIDFYSVAEKQYQFACKEWTSICSKVDSLIIQLTQLNKEADSKKTTKFHSELKRLLALSSPETNQYIDYSIYVSNVAKISLQGQKIDTNPCVAVVKELRELLDDISSLALFLSYYPVIQELIPLLDEFQTNYNRKKRQAGILTFADSAQLALATLQKFPDVRQAEKETYKSIMIDEFQDDNELQKQLLYCLAEKLNQSNQGKVRAEQLEPDKLFFVGDEKQSIYRFRGADVSVFQELSQELKESIEDKSQSALLHLSYNYRSQPDLIDSFNKIFGGYVAEDSTKHPGIFREATFFSDKKLPGYEAGYTETIAGIAAEKKRVGKGHVRFCFFNTELESENEKPLPKEECEGSFVAEKINELIKEQGYNARDIALLFRSTTHQYQYEKYLRINNIPYCSESGGRIFIDGPANDIYCFLKLCLYPKDISAYSILLRSPFVALSHQSMEKVINCSQQSIFDASVADELPEVEKNKFLHGCKIYEQVRQYAGLEPLSDTVCRLWYVLGYRYETLWNATVRQYSEIFDFIYQLACQADLQGKSLASFIDWLEAIESQEIKMDNMDIPLERGDSVRLMTIHSSKGLEFPVVFLCDCSNQGVVNKNDKAVYYSKDWGITFNLPPLPGMPSNSKNYFYSKAKEQEEKEEEAELRRLLYVAMTRAEKELFVVGNINGKTYFNNVEDDYSKVCRSFTKMLQPMCLTHLNKQPDAPFVFEEIPARQYQVAQETTENTKENKAAFVNETYCFYKDAVQVKEEVIPWPYRDPSSFEPEFVSGEHKDDVADEISILVESTKVATENSFGFSYADFGTAAHFCLEMTLNANDVVFPTKLVRALSDKQVKTLHLICSDMAQRFISSDLGKNALKSLWRRTEFHFKFKIQRCILNGIIDLIFRDYEGFFNIVDYKTDKKENPQLYYVQQGIYRKAVAAIFGVPENTIRCFLFYLRSGNVVDITENCNEIDLYQIIQESFE